MWIHSPHPYLPPGWRAAGRTQPAPARWWGPGIPSCWTLGRCRLCRLAGWWRWSWLLRLLECDRRSALWPYREQNKNRRHKLHQTGLKMSVYMKAGGAQSLKISTAVYLSAQKVDKWPESNHRNSLKERSTWTSTHIHSIKPRRWESHWENTITHSPRFWPL